MQTSAPLDLESILWLLGSVEQKRVKAKDQFQEFAEAFYGLPFSEIGPIDQSLGLTRYYVSKIHNRLAPSIDEEDFEEALVDGKSDLGVDLIHRDDGIVYIFQSKYRKACRREDIESFQSVLERLKSRRFKANKLLTDQLSEIDWESDKFVLKFLCMGKIEGDARIQCDQRLVFPAKPNDLAERVSIDYFDESGLNEELRRALSTLAGIPGEITLYAHGPRNDRSSIIELPFSEYNSVVLVVGVAHIVKMYKEAKNSLFTLNIRNYIGSTLTNKNIAETAINNPSHLFHFNNGISCIAKRLVVNHENSTVATEGLQVINGAQTVRALHKAAASSGSLSSDAYVLMRITEVQYGYGESSRFASDITRFNNTQNVIKISDFRSNDSIQSDLVKKFRGIKRHGGKKVEYTPKRSDEPKRQTISVRLEEFAKVCYSFLEDPIKFAGSSSFLFNAEDGGGYAKIFGDGKHVWEVMPLPDFKLRSAVWWMASAFAERLKEDKKASTDKIFTAALERKWFVIYAARLVLDKCFGPEDARIRLACYWEGDWILDEGKTGKLFMALYKAATRSVHHVYREASKGEQFSHRNWMRNMNSCIKIEEFVETVNDMFLVSLEGF